MRDERAEFAAVGLKRGQKSLKIGKGSEAH